MTTPTNPVLAVVLTGAIAGSACSPSGGDKDHCKVHGDCLGGYICAQGTCVSAIQDAASENPDVPPPPSPLFFVVEDFERGPGISQSPAGSCVEPVFSGLKPGGLGLSCDWPGTSPSACPASFFCEGRNYAGICLDYIGADKGAWRGDYSLRVFYNLDADPSAFTGLVFNLAAQGSIACLVNRPPLDLSKFDTLSVHVRAMDEKSNAELALQDASQLETLPKSVLVQLGDPGLPAGEWVERRFKLCDLLPSVAGDAALTSLDQSAITKVIIGFARSRFSTEGTDAAGLRYLDIDDLMLLPCPTTGCKPCP